MMKFLNNKRYQTYFFIFLASFLLYSNTISHDYAWDDKIVVEKNPRVQKGIAGIPDLFVKYNSQYQYDKYGYRPITLISLAIEYDLAPGNPHFSHFMNAFYYSVLCVLLFIFLATLFSQYHWVFSLMISTLFLAHPLHVEVVANIKSRDEILGLLFSLLAFISFMKYFSTRKWQFIGYSLIFYFLAFLSKENVITMLAVFPLIVWIKKIKINAKIVIASLTTLILCGVASFFIYILSSKSVAGVETSMGKGIYEEDGILGNSFFHLYGLSQKLPNSIHILGLYLKNFVIPYPLIYYYGYNVIPVTGWSNPVVIISLIVHILLFAVGIRYIKKRPEILFGFLFYIIAISIYTHLLRTLSDTMADRFIFFGSIGLCITLIGILGLILRINWSELKNKKSAQDLSLKEFVKTRGLVIYFTLIVSIVFGVLTVSRNKVWENDLTLVKHDLPFMENCSRAHYYYATLLNTQLMEDKSLATNMQKRQKVEAEMIKHYKRSMEISDYAYNAYTELGSYYCRNYRYNEGIEIFEKAIELFPQASEPYFYLGQTYVLTNQYKPAIPLLEKSLELAYNQATNYYFLAMAYSRTYRYDDALKTVDYGLEKFPNDRGLFYDALGFIYFEKGELDKSIEYTFKLKDYGKPEKDVYSYIIGRCYAAGDTTRGNNYLKEAQAKGIVFQ